MLFRSVSTRAQQAQQQTDPGSQLVIFESVLQRIENDYVDEPNMEKVRGGALRGLANGLDPYSTYLSASQVKDYQAGGTKNTVGIGAELSQLASYLYIIAPVKGGPADQAGCAGPQGYLPRLQEQGRDHLEAERAYLGVWAV